ncbi:MAG: N-acetylmuramoyl-L-alanine amidase [Phascolarctobacterium sp.]|nr:MAG: N-acetylmuramoyl-L-alanine amidase [Phascolarctobacterium sp.]
MHKKIICCVMFLISIFACVSAYAAEVTDVRWGLDKYNVLRLVVDLDSAPSYNISFEGQTMLVTVNADLNAKVTRSFKMRSTLAPTMTVAGSAGKTVLKLPLSRTIGTQDYNAFTLKNDPVTKRPNRLVVDITADKTATPSVVIPKTTPAKTEAAKPAATTPKATTPKTTTPKATVPKTSASKVTVPKKTEEKKEETKVSKAKSGYKTSGGIKGKKITLDAGHGGSDPGAIGASGTREKDVTLKITKKVEELLKKKGAKVSMTRTDDKDVYGPNASDVQELQARVDVAEDNDADAFISIHINSSTNKNVGGFSSYYYPKTSNDARLAQAVQDRLVKNFGLDDLGIRKANFYVNKRCSMPSTLLELAFISNPKEEKLMKSNWYINKLAKSIAEGIEDYFE